MKINNNIKILKELFWDYNWESVLKNLCSPFVIARVLEIGSKKQVVEFIKLIGDEKIKEFLQNYENLLTRQSRNFWKLYYGIKEKPFKKA